MAAEEKQSNGMDFNEDSEVLRIEVQELKIQNAALTAETHMFEQFFSRLDQHDLATAENPRAKSGGGRWRQTSQPEDELTLQQKRFVVLSELMETQQEQDKVQEKNELTHDGLRDSMKEAELRQEDIRKAKRELEHTLLKPLREKRLDIHKPEKVLRYIKDKSKINQIERCSLKIQSLQILEKSLQQQLQLRKDLGKADYEDFFQDVLEQNGGIRLQEVHVNRIKAQQSLNSYKEKLHDVAGELSTISKDITEKQQKLVRLEEAIDSAKAERSAAETLNKHLKQQNADYKAPESTEYLLLKKKHRELQQSLLTWERKVGVAETALKACSKPWSKRRGTFTPANSAETRAEGKLPHTGQNWGENRFQ